MIYGCLLVDLSALGDEVPKFRWFRCHHVLVHYVMITVLALIADPEVELIKFIDDG